VRVASAVVGHARFGRGPSSAFNLLRRAVLDVGRAAYRRSDRGRPRIHPDGDPVSGLIAWRSSPKPEGAPLGRHEIFNVLAGSYYVQLDGRRSEKHSADYHVLFWQPPPSAPTFSFGVHERMTSPFAFFVSVNECSGVID